MEQQVILLLIGLGMVSTILLLYYNSKIASYCCLENTMGARSTTSYNVIKPPRWSQCLASKIEYIEDTALDIVRKRIEYIDKLVAEKLGVLALISRNENPYTTLLFKIKFISTTSRRTGFIGALKILLDLTRLRKLYVKASKLSGIDEKRQEYYDVIERILEYIDNLTMRLEEL